MNQEAFGNLVTNPSLQFFPFAVFIEQLGEWHQATFFYESIWNLCVFAVLIYFRKKTRFSGQLLATYFIGYGLGRFWIEGLRTDSLYLFPGFRVSQAVSLALIAAGIVMMIFHKKLFKIPLRTRESVFNSIKNTAVNFILMAVFFICIVL